MIKLILALVLVVMSSACGIIAGHGGCVGGGLLGLLGHGHNGGKKGGHSKKGGHGDRCEYEKVNVRDCRDDCRGGSKGYGGIKGGYGGFDCELPAPVYHQTCWFLYVYLSLLSSFNFRNIL